jgi:hypothetical protein
VCECVQGNRWDKGRGRLRVVGPSKGREVESGSQTIRKSSRVSRPASMWARTPAKVGLQDRETKDLKLLMFVCGTKAAHLDRRSWASESMPRTLMVHERGEPVAIGESERHSG